MRQTGGTLWQWDSGRQVLCPPSATAAHFAARGDGEAYATEPDASGLADIPNLLLQRAGEVLCWATDGERTLDSGTLRVRRRAKPPEYVYTATDVWAVEAVVAEAVAAALEGITADDIGLEAITDEEIEETF